MRALPLMMVIVLALFIAPAIAADVTIPISKDYRQGDMLVHIIQVSITDRAMGNVYSVDPENTVWPKLVFTYENKGAVAMNGNLQIAFYDDQWNQYPATGYIMDGTMNPIEPGKTSELRFVEAAVMPKDTKITHFRIFEAGKNATYDIAYPGVATTTTAPPGTAGTNNACCLSVLLPLLAIGVFLKAKQKI